MNKEIEEVVKELSVVIEAMASEKNSKIKGVLDTEIRKAVMYQKADWLRSEIEKLEGMMGNIPPYPHEGAHGQAITLAAQRGYQDVLTSIITRYKEELKVLESK